VYASQEVAIVVEEDVSDMCLADFPAPGAFESHAEEVPSLAIGDYLNEVSHC
jgi:hypothetical protein